MWEESARADLAVSRIAGRQHGVISIEQLREAGLGRTAVTTRVQAGRLYRLHRGVYAVGHAALSAEGRWLAAVLACGRRMAFPGLGTDQAHEGKSHAQGRSLPVLDLWGAALSHRSAAELWGLLPAGESPVDISIPRDPGRKRRRGVRLHRSLTLRPADVTLKGGIPVTKSARTVTDLRQVAGRPGGAGGISLHELRRAIRQAEFLGLPLGPGDGDRTRSDLERDFLRLCRGHRLPRPEVNVRVGRFLVDFLWRDRRLVVETDGYVAHRGRIAFRDDRGRDLRLRGLGYTVIRLAEQQIDEEPAEVATILRAELAT